MSREAPSSDAAGSAGSPAPTAAPVTSLRGAGPKVADRLARLDIHTVEDLLFHLPARYEDRTRVSAMGSLEPGRKAVVEGLIELSEISRGGRRSLLCRITDGTGWLTLRFFHFSARQTQQLVRGTRLWCYGEVRSGPLGPELVHPEYRILASGEPTPVETRLTPVYPATEGLSQNLLRRLTGQALELAARQPPWDPLPEAIAARCGFMALGEALGLVHRPPADSDPETLAAGHHPAQRRLAFEELLAYQVSMRQLRARAREETAPSLETSELRERLLGGLEIRLTEAQERVLREILSDLAATRPMMRLLQGDVGSGKTVVAALAAAQALASGYQVAVMTPTELLAEQHWRSFAAWLEPLGERLEWLTGRVKGRARRDALARLASGEAGLAVGTHALFQEDVHFRALGLVIIDEQHRFGVHQRLALREKGESGSRHPHQLIMTATPIPRTLAMTVYADLDVSTIDELPPGRAEVQTAAIPESRRTEVIERVRRACASGAQAYWVCTLVAESEALQAQAAEDTAASLAAALPELTVGLIHGRLQPEEKEAVMRRFAAGEIDVLVATTVIEVGVDVPDATLMIIENPERLGLSQLHQLRGRVGRGRRSSHCVLLYRPPLSRAAQQRLSALRELSDGFRIAQRDQDLRGSGELLGTRQAGEWRMRIADPLRDGDMTAMVQQIADTLLTEYPERVEPLLQRWLASAGRYAQA